MKRKIKYTITFLHFLAKLAWWMVTMGIIFLALPFIMDWCNDLLFTIPYIEAEIDMWFLGELSLGFSNHDFINLLPLWFLLSGLGIVCYHFYKAIKWMKENKVNE